MNQVTTRAPHKCRLCGEIIPTGTHCNSDAKMETDRHGEQRFTTRFWQHIKCPKSKINDCLSGTYTSVRTTHTRACAICGDIIPTGALLFVIPNETGPNRYIHTNCSFLQDPSTPTKKEPSQMELFDPLINAIKNASTPRLQEVKVVVDKELESRKIPEWLKPGQWVWEKDSGMKLAGVGCIAAMPDKGLVRLTNGQHKYVTDFIKGHFVPVSLRPWSAETALKYLLSGKSLLRNGTSFELYSVSAKKDKSFRISYGMGLCVDDDRLVSSSNYVYETWDHKPMAEVVFPK